MSDIKAVIGANYGDEGKGLMTDYFCRTAICDGKKTIVVCNNGGAQRGHTVVSRNIRHVFHHFGSGTLAGADTFLCQYYILNPILFREEWEQIHSYGIVPKVYIHSQCIWSTPYDMILNQMIEESRGENKHGSCGVGIWETIVRNRQEAITIEEAFGMCEAELKERLIHIRDIYFSKRLKENNLAVNDYWQSIIMSDNLLEHFIEDFFFMKKQVEIQDDSILNIYDSVVFENGQGLLLDKGIKEHRNHTTPSNTGIKNIAKIIKNIDNIDTMEICYVTRTYLTRHGAGPFPYECSKNEINESITDETNIPNPFQGTIRYGRINLKQLIERVTADAGLFKASLAVTHMNETDNMFMSVDLLGWKDVNKAFGKVYCSDHENSNSVKLLNYKAGVI